MRRLDRTLALMPVIPLAKSLQETDEKCGEILAKMFADFVLKFPGKSLQGTGEKTRRKSGETFCRFSSTDFQGKWPQEISRKILDIVHTAPNNWRAFRQGSSLEPFSGDQMGGPKWGFDRTFVRSGPTIALQNRAGLRTLFGNQGLT